MLQSLHTIRSVVRIPNIHHTAALSQICTHMSTTKEDPELFLLNVLAASPTSRMYSYSTSSTMSIAVQAAALAAARVVQWRHEQRRRGRPVRQRIGTHRRSRNEVEDTYQQVGPTNVKKAYRMKYHSFKRLARKLRNGIIEFLLVRRQRNHHSSSSTPERKYWYVPNGPITPSVCLARALCYFAGGSLYDIIT
jgi:hypothetical protein